MGQTASRGARIVSYNKNKKKHEHDLLSLVLAQPLLSHVLLWILAFGLFLFWILARAKFKLELRDLLDTGISIINTTYHYQQGK
jgi:hypothetical protein